MSPKYYFTNEEPITSQLAISFDHTNANFVYTYKLST